MDGWEGARRHAVPERGEEARRKREDETRTARHQKERHTLEMNAWASFWLHPRAG
jgi:hypothetical protein